MNVCKLELTDSPMSICIKMSEGNPGALSVVMRLFKENETIDPDGMGPFTAILRLDSLNVYGSEIWMLYKDVCGENLSRMCAVLRANQLGFVSSENIKHSILGNNKLAIDDLCAQVCKFLPKFNLK